MTRSDNSVQCQAGEAGSRQPPGAARLIPKVTFGLGTAVLAGVVVVSVMAVPAVPGRPAAPGVPAAPAVRGVPAVLAVHPAVHPAGQPVITTTVGLGAVINAVAGSAALETTCCG